MTPPDPAPDVLFVVDGGPGRLVDSASARLLSMGCNVEEACPATTVPMDDRALEDREGQPIDRLRESRDEIGARVRDLIAELSREGSG